MIYIAVPNGKWDRRHQSDPHENEQLSINIQNEDQRRKLINIFVKLCVLYMCYHGVVHSFMKIVYLYL